MNKSEKKFLAVFIRRILIDAKAKVSLIKVETEGRHCLPENDLTGLPTSTELLTEYLGGDFTHMPRYMCTC
jgi:hypothetical protein